MIQALYKKFKNFAWDIYARQRINIALTKGSVSRSARRLDYSRPDSWEFSGFSQNGEDGILDVLLGKLLASDRYFVEIGASDGIENNTSWLLAVCNYSGIMVEGDPDLVARANRTLTPLGIGGYSHSLFVTRDNVGEIRKLARELTPDVLSVDIDGVDYFVVDALFSEGFRPKIFVVEFNSAYGPERKVSVPYSEKFQFSKADSSLLYYGVSIAAWRNYFEKQGYRFITVDTNGVNAFFVDPACFPKEFLEGVVGLEFAENALQLRRYPGGFEVQFRLIEKHSFLSL